MNTANRNFDFQSGKRRFVMDVSIEPSPAPKRALFPGEILVFPDRQLKFTLHQEKMKRSRTSSFEKHTDKA